LKSVALIGAGGIGKTSIALTVLHHDRIKRRFGEDRRFIRCDQFPATPAHFLARLSKVTGADVENPEDLASLRPFLSSKEMAIVIDNAESILDPQGTHGREIYNIVEELSRLETVCLCITSRISTTPRGCKTLIIPTLSMEAACDTFYRIYGHDERSDSVSNILERLDFHPLSITLLATVAHHNRWDTDRLSREWESRRTDILRTEYNESLATTIELSLASPTFRDLGPDARDLLEIVAFFPQGVDKDNTDWLFPAISNREDTFDKFRILSLTYQSNGFITMLSPFREYLHPKDPKLSPLLCTTKDHYFSRLSAEISPGNPGFSEASWIMSEDVNIEHLLNIFTSVDPTSANIWDACCHFMEHLYRHKPRLVTLGPKIKGLPDDHPSKPQCLFELSRLFGSVGNYTESRRLQVHTLELWKKRGRDFDVAETLLSLSETSRHLEHRQEGIHQAREAYTIFGRLNSTDGQERSMRQLASLYGDDQLEVISTLDEGQKHMYCQLYRAIGYIYHSQGKIERAIDRFEAALEIASSCEWHDQQFWILHTMVELFSDEGMFDDAHAHVERAKLHAANDPYLLGCAMELLAQVFYEQHRLNEAKSEVLRAVGMFEKLGKMQNVESCREFLQDIEAGMESPELDLNGEPLNTVLFFVLNNSPFPDRGAQ